MSCLKAAEIVAGVVRRSRHRRCGDEQESLGACGLGKAFELLRRNIASDSSMFPRRLQVLADRQKVDARRSEVVHDLEDFFAGFSKADHDPRLRESLRVDFLGSLQEPE